MLEKSLMFHNSVFQITLQMFSFSLSRNKGLHFSLTGKSTKFK